MYVQYLPEAIAWLGAIGIGIANGSKMLGRHRTLTAGGACVIVAWTVSALWSSASISTALIGFRSELRFVPLALIVGASANVARDGRLYARVIVWSALLQSAVAILEVVGGYAVRAIFAPSYTIVIGGLQVTAATPRPGSHLWNFQDYNDLGICLTFGVIVALCAGTSVLGWAPWKIWCAVALWVGVIVISGSRESLVALVVAVLLVARLKRGLPAFRIVLVAAAGAAVLVPLIVHGPPLPSSTPTRGSLTARWEALLNPGVYSASSGDNSRLSLLDAEVNIARAHPLVGFGPGTVVDPRSLANGSNPLYRSTAGTTAIDRSYYFDGEWGLLLVEVGVLGVAAMAMLLLAVGKIARVAARGKAWFGDALVAILSVCVLLGFFTSIFESRQPMSVLWTLVGLCAASTVQRQARSSS